EALMIGVDCAGLAAARVSPSVMVPIACGVDSSGSVPSGFTWLGSGGAWGSTPVPPLGVPTAFAQPTAETTANIQAILMAGHGIRPRRAELPSGSRKSRGLGAGGLELLGQLLGPGVVSRGARMQVVGRQLAGVGLTEHQRPEIHVAAAA